MTSRLGIELLTVFGMPPVEQVKLAAELGCGHISTGLTAVPWKLEQFPEWSLREDAKLRKEMIAAMADMNIAISLAEGFSVRPGIDATDQAADMDIMAELGAKQVNAVCMEPDLTRTRDQFALLADMAKARGMGFCIEYAPPHPLNNLDMTLSMIDDIGSPNMHLLIDAMHFFRSGGTLSTLTDINPLLISHIQLSDVPLVAPHDDYYQEACFERKIPGEGELPLRELLAALPTNIPIGLEIPMISRVKSGEPLPQLVAQAVTASRALLPSLD